MSNNLWNMSQYSCRLVNTTNNHVGGGRLGGHGRGGGAFLEAWGAGEAGRCGGPPERARLALSSTGAAKVSLRKGSPAATGGGGRVGLRWSQEANGSACCAAGPPKAEAKGSWPSTKDVSFALLAAGPRAPPRPQGSAPRGLKWGTAWGCTNLDHSPPCI